MDNGSWFIVHGNLLFMGYLFCADQMCYFQKKHFVILNAVKDPYSLCFFALYSLLIDPSLRSG